MSSISYYTVGRWHDYSHPEAIGDVFTLDVHSGGRLIAALSTFVGFVGAATWTIVAFTIHQFRAKPDKHDGVYFQQQAVYRNSGSAPGALWDIFCICWSWRRKERQEDGSIS
jgi:hypothetical protein